jgi:4a-hydroxytetrahydrobiopterin dehydratase
MSEPDDLVILSRTEAQAAVEDLGWRYLLGTYSLSIPVDSLEDASSVAVSLSALPGADDHLRIDLRPRRLELSVQTRAVAGVTARAAQMAVLVSAVIAERGLAPKGNSTEGHRPVQMLEVAIDAIDIASIRPFWKAVLAYTDEPCGGGPEDPIVDPTGQLPAFWFQQMDQSRPQRNRIHLDITVAHDEAEARVAAALAAGGRLVSDEYARSFWVLADAEGNEACVCTWLDRDERLGDPQ